MTFTEVIQRAKYLINEDGAQTDVVLPIETWNNLMILLQRLEQLDDEGWQQQAEQAYQNSSMVGSEVFTQEIDRLAALDS
jgi:hypothetical protein